MVKNNSRSTSTIVGPTSIPEAIKRKKKGQSASAATHVNLDEGSNAVNDEGSTEVDQKTTVSHWHEIIIKLTVIIIVGLLTFSLAVGGMIIYFYAQDKGDRIWTIIGPIIASAITGLLGILILDRRDRR